MSICGGPLFLSLLLFLFIITVVTTVIIIIIIILIVVGMVTAVGFVVVAVMGRMVDTDSICSCGDGCVVFIHWTDQLGCFVTGLCCRGL